MKSCITNYDEENKDLPKETSKKGNIAFNEKY